MLDQGARRENTSPVSRDDSAGERRECSRADGQKSAQLAKSGLPRWKSASPRIESLLPVSENPTHRTESRCASPRNHVAAAECGASTGEDRVDSLGNAWAQRDSGGARLSNPDLLRQCASRGARRPTSPEHCRTFVGHSGGPSRRCQLTRAYCHLRIRSRRVAAPRCLGPRPLRFLPPCIAERQGDGLKG